jgi:Ca2+-binding RTX toxin-like protein
MSRRWLLPALVPALVIGLVAIAGARVSATLSGGTLTIKGSNQRDVVVLDVVPGISDPTREFYSIRDPAGVKNVPPGCFRFNRTEIHCPVELVDAFVFDLKGGNDVLLVDEGILEEVEAAGGDGNDVVEGGARGDELRGGPGSDTQRGKGGGDFLTGGAGNDRQNGGPGRDRILGGGGRDSQNGGRGRDRCNGGPGNDSAASCEIGANY